MKTGEAIKNLVVAKYRKGAEHRGLVFTLSDEQVLTIFSSNCFYCGVVPSNCQLRRQTTGGFIYSGIDRQDNNEGYTPTNSVPCCRICNFAKGTMTTTEFLNWARRVVAHNSE